MHRWKSLSGFSARPRRALLCSVLSLAALAALWPSSAGARPLYTGITNLDTTARLAFERTRAAGARFVRIPLYWAATAPEKQPASWQPTDPNDPNYNWGESDNAVNAATAAGLVPVLLVDGAPAWVQRCATPFFAHVSMCNPDPEALGAFATAAARHYSGLVPGVPRVQYWQGLNEPNLSLFFNPQFDGAGNPVSPDLYRALLESFYAGIKGVDPSNLVIAAGLGPIAVPKYTIGPMKFARLLLCMAGSAHPHPVAVNCGAGVHFDIFAIQPYTTGGPTHEGGVNDVELGDLAKLQRLLRAADRAGRIVSAYKQTPLWVTELSWDSKPPDPGGLPMKIEMRWIAEALYRSWTAGVDHFFWFSLRDDPPEPSRPFSETLQSGLYYRGATLEQDEPKPILPVFRFPFVAFPQKNGLEFWGRTPNGGPGKVSIQVWRGGHWRQVDLVKADRQGIFRGVANTPYGGGKHGSARAKLRHEGSTPFSMKPVGDFRHPPFG